MIRQFLGDILLLFRRRQEPEEGPAPLLVVETPYSSCWNVTPSAAARMRAEMKAQKIPVSVRQMTPQEAQEFDW